MGAVSSRPLQTVAVVDLSVACFLIHVKLNDMQTGERERECDEVNFLYDYVFISNLPTEESKSACFITFLRNKM